MTESVCLSLTLREEQLNEKRVSPEGFEPIPKANEYKLLSGRNVRNSV